MNSNLNTRFRVFFLHITQKIITSSCTELRSNQTVLVKQGLNFEMKGNKLNISKIHYFDIRNVTLKVAVGHVSASQDIIYYSSILLAVTTPLRALVFSQAFSYNC